MQSKRPSRPSASGIGRSRWHVSPTDAPAAVRRWQATPGSLTAAVRAVSTSFVVRRQLEAWQALLRDEATPLRTSPRQQAWTREVLLCDGPTPLVFAHTVATRAALPAWPWLRGLGDRPLGEVLFQHHGVSRQPLEFCRLDARHRLYRAAARHLEASGLTAGPHLFARRSVFVLRGQRLLVTEVFLPELLDRS